jgi:hypothetical protein
MASERMESLPESYALIEKPMPLGLPSDKDWLSPLHCFVRKHCIQVFTDNTEEEFASHSKSKCKPLYMGQVGLRCSFCHRHNSHTINNESCNVRYPMNSSKLYQVAMELMRRHVSVCPRVPKDVLLQYETLKAARSGNCQRYWMTSAQSLGLVDTVGKGIRFSASLPPPPNLHVHNVHDMNEIQEEDSHVENDNGEARMPENVEDGEVDDSKIPANDTAHTDISPAEPTLANGTPLVVPEDMEFATTYSYQLLCQMQPCHFTEADRLGKRQGLPLGFPGLACRHCGGGRSFAASIKTLSDTSKTLHALHSHMMRCVKCPLQVQESLEQLRSTHEYERSLKFGSQKAFFTRIWDRLHGASDRVLAWKRRHPTPQEQLPLLTLMDGNVPLQTAPLGESRIDVMAVATHSKRQKTTL